MPKKWIAVVQDELAGIKVVGEADNMEAALQLARDHGGDCAGAFKEGTVPHVEPREAWQSATPWRKRRTSKG